MNNLLWNLKAKLYHKVRSRFPLNLILKRENQNLELMLRSLDIHNKKVMDLGTGIGNAIRHFKNSNIMFAIDFSFSMLHVARQIYPYVHFVQANALTVPLKANSMDCITAVGLTEYLKNLEPLFKEIYRLLKSKGFLILTFSPYGIWTRLRLLFGLPIYPRTLDELISIARNERFQHIKNSHSLMQRQVLLQKA